MQNHLLGIFEYEKNKYAARDAHNFQSAKAFASTTSQPLTFIAHAAVEKAESSVKVVLFNLPQVTVHTSLSPVQKKIAIPKSLVSQKEEIQNMRVVPEPMTLAKFGSCKLTFALRILQV
ncbi:hypothetical protein K435DRAFT_807100 [Dendrothele bispora CBS 962.96]|uniref:Uncharacterized protein n=1 Tax=Dendrothele bispora (strain CBS 962.96) TaxID=1314807 RepID=A0A4S8L698_DENBC|nr:hypothetical protein K435DRAFT_807100 [Dendrothele bispora CBS 962.96]